MFKLHDLVAYFEHSNAINGMISRMGVVELS